MLHRMARVEYPCHYPQGSYNNFYGGAVKYETLELTRPKTVPGGAVKCPNHLVNQIDIADLN